MIGQYIRNYKITAHLGEGGMGTVYSATDDILGRTVALKMLHSTLTKQPQFLDRFKKEARVLAQLLHPNIAVIYNFIEQDENHFMVMEYVEGKNLESLQKTLRKIPYIAIVAMFVQALEGLRHAHKKGILHRDIKPANLNLTPDGTVKLMDFGIALMAGEQRLTQVNRIVGTVEFMAPELIQGKEPSAASDLYAVGVTMYELLTGKLPFESNTDYNLMQEILKKKPISAEKVNADIPRTLANVVMKSMEKNPEHRYVDAKAFQNALLTAFPDAKDFDLSSLYNSPAVPDTRVVHVSTDGGIAATKVVTRNTSTSNAFTNTLTRVRQHKQGLKILVASCVLVILVALFSVAGMMSGTTTIAQAEVPQPVKDSIRRDSSVENSILPTPVQPVPLNLPVTTTGEEKKEIDKEEKGSTEKKPSETKKEKAGEKKEIEGGVEEKKETIRKEEPVIPETIKEEVVPEVKRASRTVTLDSRLEVNLYLLQPIDASSAQSGQHLEFSVTTAVRYDGETLIENGATATGQIKSINNKKISIQFLSVTARNGQKIPFVATEFSGRIAHMLSSRNYSATLKRGTTINL